MIHEFIEIIQSYKTAAQNHLQSVVATVVDLDGSSYRKPGVRMIIHENGDMKGAVSGGCVEKEILKQSYSVFKNGESKIITYDGRYRLGCEGVLYILIELFDPERELFNAFDNCLSKRKHLEIVSFYVNEVAIHRDFGSVISIDKRKFAFNKNIIHKGKDLSKYKVFKQKLAPLFRLLIVGEEHDAVQLSKQAYFLGWEVFVIISPSSPRSLNDFPGAKRLIHTLPSQMDLSLVDNRTAIVLMTHNYARDVQFLYALTNSVTKYIGLLGSFNRRERLLNEFIEKKHDVESSFLDRIYGPTGLSIGAITPQEIALSICSEILSIFRNKKHKILKNSIAEIHRQVMN